uniref:Glycosyltransferase 61 catalytic domain-containing protein n=1 Tax=Ananas comosus var. bracteatus TaxID=296719 RepID=A0A6V7PAX2_ANACO|nr:unnamed protein product [Ananas comosus var. bracteatus]
MSKYRIVDLAADQRVHCFSEMIVGLRFHGELVIDPQQMPNGEGIQDFQALLRQAFDGPPLLRKSRQRRQQAPPPPPPPPPTFEHREPAGPRIVIFVRNQTRVLLNLREVVEACEEAGFRAQVVDAKQHTPLAAIHRAVASSDALLAVHGAAVTHFLFMRPPAALLQIVPIGLDWAADAFYGAPARRLGLEYVEYKVSAEESSLSDEYDRRSPVLADPSAVAGRGWWEMKKVYMDKQNVRVNVSRFSATLQRVYRHVCALHLHACVRVHDVHASV